MTQAAHRSHALALMLLLLGFAVAASAQVLDPRGITSPRDGVTQIPLRRTKPATAEEVAKVAPPLPEQLGSALCRDGWFPAWTGSLSLGSSSRTDPPRVLCLQVNPRANSWESSQATCRRGNGFLLKMETEINIGDLTLPNFLQRQDVDSAWTGIHSANDKFVWDEPRPNIVESFVEEHASFGKIKRGWDWNYDRFSNPDGCGLVTIESQAPTFPPTQPPLRRHVRDVTPPTAWSGPVSESRDPPLKSSGVFPNHNLQYSLESPGDSVFHPRLRGPGIFGNHLHKAPSVSNVEGPTSNDFYPHEDKGVPNSNISLSDHQRIGDSTVLSDATVDRVITEMVDRLHGQKDINARPLEASPTQNYSTLDFHIEKPPGEHRPPGRDEGMGLHRKGGQRHILFRRSPTGNRAATSGSSPWGSQTNNWGQGPGSGPHRQGGPLPPSGMAGRGAGIPSPSRQSPFRQGGRNGGSQSWNSGMQSPSFGGQQFSSFQGPPQQGSSFQPQALSLQQPQQQSFQQSLQQPLAAPLPPSPQQSFQQPFQQPLNSPLPQPQSQSFQQPLQQSFQQSLNSPLPQPQSQSFQQPLQQSFQQPLQQSIEQSLQQPLQPSFQQPLQPSLSQSLQQPIQQAIQQQQVQQSIQQLRQPLQQPPSAQQPLQQSVQQSLQQPLQQGAQQTLQRFNNPMYQNPYFPNLAMQTQNFQNPSFPMPSQSSGGLNPSSLYSNHRGPPLLQSPTGQSLLDGNVEPLKSPSVDLTRQDRQGGTPEGSDAAFGPSSGQWGGTSTTMSTPTLYPPFMMTPDRENLPEGEEVQSVGGFPSLSGGDSLSSGRGFGGLLENLHSRGGDAASLSGSRDGGTGNDRLNSFPTQDSQWPTDSSNGAQFGPTGDFNARSENFGRLLGDFPSQGGSEGPGGNEDAAERGKMDSSFTLQGNGGVLFNDKMSDASSRSFPSPSSVPSSAQSLVSALNASLPLPTVLGSRLGLSGFGGGDLQGLQSFRDNGGEEGDQIQTDIQKLINMFGTTTVMPDTQALGPSPAGVPNSPSPSSKTQTELDLEDTLVTVFSNDTSQETNSSKEEDSMTSSSEEYNSTTTITEKKVETLDLSSTVINYNDNDMSADSNETSNETISGEVDDGMSLLEDLITTTQSSDAESATQSIDDQLDWGKSQDVEDKTGARIPATHRPEDYAPPDTFDEQIPPKRSSEESSTSTPRMAGVNRERLGRLRDDPARPRSSDDADEDDDKTDDSEEERLFETSTMRAASFRPLQGAEMALYSDSTMWMNLDKCEARHPSVCFAEPIKDLRPGGDCPPGWVGHPLVDTCFKLVSTRGGYSEASGACLALGGKLARASLSIFHGNLSAKAANFLLSGSGRQVWVESEAQQEGRCSALQGLEIVSGDCSTPLSGLCEMSLPRNGLAADPQQLGVSENKTVLMMNSHQLGTLRCPIALDSPFDVIVWYKDGLPLQEPGQLFQSLAEQRNPYRSRVTLASGSELRLEAELLGLIWRRQGLMMKLSSLQGTYWCQVWKLRPLRSLQGPKTLVIFSDVVTLHGELRTGLVDQRTALYFNRLGAVQGAARQFESDMDVLNKEALRLGHGISSALQDVCTLLTSLHEKGGRLEFLTYLRLNAQVPVEIKEQIAMTYMKSLHDVIKARDSALAEHWNTSGPATEAITLRTTEMCLQAFLVDRMTGRGATFPRTQPNSQAYSEELCGGIPVGVATCKGDLERGAVWDSWQVTSTCTEEPRGPSLPSVPVPDTFQSGDDREVEHLGPGGQAQADLLELHQMDVKSHNVEDVADKLAKTVEKADHLSAPDIVTVANVIDKIVAVDAPPPTVGERLLRSVNKLLEADELDILQAEKQTKAATRILEDVDMFGKKTGMAASSSVRLVTPNVAMEIWELEAGQQPVIGLGAMMASSWSVPFSDPRILTIRNRSEAALTSFDVAIELPDSLVRDSMQESNTSRLSMVIYRKTGFFRSANMVVNGSADMVNSAIISASLAGRRVENLQDRVRLVFKPFMDTANHVKATRCVFWNFTLYGRHGGWSSKGCVYNGTLDGRDVCLCDHLTNFAVLLDFYGDGMPISPDHKEALNIISKVGLALSITGLALTIISFVVFRKLRQGRAQQTLFNMALAMLCSDLVFVLGIKETGNYYVCLVMAVLLHYFILVSFVWMLVEAVLQYLIFVKVLGTYISRYHLKTVLPAWGLPLVPIIAVMAYDYRLYRGHKEYCWMDLRAFYFAFAAPVGLVIVTNLIMFVVIMVNLAKRPDGLRSNQSKHHTARTNLKAAVTIFVLLGLTWAFGYMAIAEARLAFQYVFTLLSTLQGFFLFILLVVRRKQVRELWRNKCCCRRISTLGSRRKVTAMNSNSVSSSNSGVSTASTRTLASRKGSSPLAHACSESPVTRARLPVDK